MYTQNSQSTCKENARQHYNCFNSKHTKKKNTVTTDWIENKINKVHNAHLCFIEFKVGNWSEEKTSLLCFVLFANMSLVLVQFPIPVYINLSQLLQNYL